MGSFSDPRTPFSRILIGSQEREVSSLEEALGFIRECDGDGLAELLASQARAAGMDGDKAILALKGRLDAFRSVLAEY
ncbi:hypothetical protein GCM10007301_47730 [Azorhizobium oxalatiphilum]|uniref:Uncharacterized protein n=1 Tax=Azorhizobium oxalatiphilum TaxID=980631 RepID=A0A917FIC8_9HYPH|nr:hypothetical protein [Azorhizobium oxalatiphilum]GGF82086.1 hypothetical protein GCM10007301_47730 [Azorhizobium oxalatiphilum]